MHEQIYSVAYKNGTVVEPQSEFSEEVNHDTTLTLK